MKLSSFFGFVNILGDFSNCVSDICIFRGVRVPFRRAFLKVAFFIVRSHLKFGL